MAHLPGEKTYHMLVLRVKWKAPFGLKCLDCVHDVIESCEKQGLKEIPKGNETDDIFVPFGWLNWKCHHEGSVYFGFPPVRSSYEDQ